MKETLNQIDIAEQVRLIAESSGRIKSLPGSQTSSRSPSPLNVAGQSLLKEDLATVFSELRAAFEYRRVDLTVSGPEDGYGAITTADFDYEVAISQQPDDAARYLVRRSICGIRNPDLVFSRRFEVALTPKFRAIELHSHTKLPLESIIDRMEANGQKNVSVDYDPGVTWCSIRIGSLIVRIAGSTVQLEDEDKSRGPAELFQSLMQFGQCAGLRRSEQG